MNKVIVITLSAACVLMTGCANKKAKHEAFEHWHRARAEVLCGIGKEHFKTGQLDEALKSAQEALVLNNSYVEAMLLLGKVFIEQEKYPQAQQILNQALTTADGSSEAWYLLGVAQERNRKYEESLASYRRSAELDPNNPEAFIAVGEVMVALDQQEKAIEYVESALSQHTNSPGLYELAGRLAMMSKDFASAAEYFDYACDLDIHNLRYREALALARILDGQHAQAVETLNAIKANPEYKASAWVEQTLGDCQLALGRPVEAIDAYDRAAKVEPDSPAIWCKLAVAAMKQGDMYRAVIAAAEALRLESYNHDAALLYAYALIKQTQCDKAVDFLAQASRLHPQSIDIQCLLGMAYQGLGDHDKAGRFYNQAVKLEPDNKLARQLLSHSGLGDQTESR